MYSFYLTVMFKLSHISEEKLFHNFIGVKFPNFQILHNLYFHFKLLLLLTGQRQLLENKQRLRNIWKFGNSTIDIAFLMTYFKGYFLIFSLFKSFISKFQLWFNNSSLVQKCFRCLQWLDKRIQCNHFLLLRDHSYIT